MQLTPKQRRVIDQVVNVFETGTPAGDYAGTLQAVAALTLAQVALGGWVVPGAALWLACAGAASSAQAQSPDAARRAERGEHGDVAATSLAKGEVVAGDDATCTDMIGQESDEGLRAQCREFGGEGEHQHRVCPGGGEQPFTLVKRGQAKGRGVRHEQAHGMGVERRDDDRATFRPGARHRASHHGLMPGMKTVEIAQRDDGPAQMRRNRRAAVQPLHGVAL